MKAGALRFYSPLRSRATTQGSDGEQVHTWSTYAVVYASKVSLRVSQQFTADVNQSQAEFESNIRYRADVQPEHRILIDGVTYEIVGVADPDGKRRELRLELLRLRPDGEG